VRGVSGQAPWWSEAAVGFRGPGIFPGSFLVCGFLLLSFSATGLVCSCRSTSCRRKETKEAAADVGEWNFAAFCGNVDLS
jgi:hypothetical protein